MTQIKKRSVYNFEQQLIKLFVVLNFKKWQKKDAKLN